MKPLFKKALSILAVLCVIGASVVAWFFIEVGFDGCCGAANNYANDNLQSLSHVAAILVAALLARQSIRWGWRDVKS